MAFHDSLPLSKIYCHEIFFYSTLLFLITVTAQAQTFDFLDINNVRARINADGDLFWDEVGTASYEVPKGSGLHTIFASALWIGGFDDNHNLKVAAQTYRQSGSDFWPGPLDSVTANCDSNLNAQWNKVWKVSKEEIDTFIFENGNNFPNTNYIVPTSIQTWPGNGDSASLQDHILTPYIDVNSDGNYNYLDGDYPCIKGDQAVVFIINDACSAHGKSGGLPLHVEIHGMAYGFQSSDSILNNTIFLNYKIIYKGTTTNVNNTYIGNWTDFDLGNYLDDYIGCDVTRNMYYAYNGDENDEGITGYGFNPPAQGVVFLKGANADLNDGLDNNRDSCIDCTLYHTSSGDSIVPDSISPEQIAMSKFMYYSNNNDPVEGSPSTALDYYNYMRGIWRNGNILTYGGSGHGGGLGATADSCSFMFPGNSDPYFWGTNGMPEAPWDELTAGNPPGDRRGVASMGGFTLQPGKVVCIDYAYVFARADTGGRLASLDSLKSSVDHIRNFYDSHPELQTCGCTPQSFSSVPNINSVFSDVSIFPNPTSGKSVLQFALKESSKIIIQILDQTGRIIKSHSQKSSTGFNRLELNLENIAKGIYFVRIETERGSTILKLAIE